MKPRHHTTNLNDLHRPVPSQGLPVLVLSLILMTIGIALMVACVEINR